MTAVSLLLNRYRRDGGLFSESDIVELLSADEADTRALYALADEVRDSQHGNEVFLRGIVEFSNHCRRDCAYCGIRRGNALLSRYRMTEAEIVEAAGNARKFGCTTVVLQSGEDMWFTLERLESLIRRIKAETPVSVTLSIGERGFEELIALKNAGCDRYLLRFETSNRGLFEAIHPDDDFDARVGCLHDLRRAGIQLGSGFMIGLPGGGLETIARDILFATSLNLDMIGCGPFIPNPSTPLGEASLLDDHEVYFRTISILRLLNPKAHIPATTAFDVLAPGARDRVLTLGGNVFMPNITPKRFRADYQLYPDKPCVDEDADGCASCSVCRIIRLGRTVGQGRGDSIVS